MDMAMKKSKWRLVGTIAMPLVGGTITGVLATRSAKKKYRHLNTPKFAAPSWVFPVAWASLYALMGAAKYQYDRSALNRDGQTQANIAYGTQLSLNYFWSFLFFRWQMRGSALVDSVLLWMAININTYYFYKKSKLAGSLMLPYIGWVTYAVGLNYATWDMNKKLEKKSLIL